MTSFFKAKNEYKTFKPLRQTSRATQQRLRECTAATLGSGDLRLAVQVPKGEDRNEWLCANTLDFFDHVSLIYGVVSEQAEEKYTKPAQGFPAGFEYLWADGVKVTTPIKCSSPQYVEYVMEWAAEKMSDPALFPSVEGAPFPPTFEAELKIIYKRLFRIYAIIYSVHMDLVQEMEAEAHLNTCFKHFMYFILEFQLVNASEMEPIAAMCNRYKAQYNGESGIPTAAVLLSAPQESTNEAHVIAPVVAPMLSNSIEKTTSVRKLFPHVSVDKSEKFGAENAKQKAQSLREQSSGSFKALDKCGLAMKAKSVETSHSVSSYVEYYIRVECGLEGGDYTPIYSWRDPERLTDAVVRRRWNDIKKLHSALGGYHIPPLPTRGPLDAFSKFSANQQRERAMYITKLGNYLLQTRGLKTDPAVMACFGICLREKFKSSLFANAGSGGAPSNQ
jgi:MOB kinase activator 1